MQGKIWETWTPAQPTALENLQSQSSIAELHTHWAPSGCVVLQEVFHNSKVTSTIEFNLYLSSGFSKIHRKNQTKIYLSFISSHCVKDNMLAMHLFSKNRLIAPCRRSAFLYYQAVLFILPFSQGTALNRHGKNEEECS